MTDAVSERMLPLYEAKMVSHYDHRAADVVTSKTAVKRQNQPGYISTDDHRDGDRLAMPKSWVNHSEVARAEQWRLGFSRISSPTNERSMSAVLLPGAAVGDSLFLLDVPNAQTAVAIISMLNCLAFDYVARQKVAGLNMNFFYVRQLPVLPPSDYLQKVPWERQMELSDWVAARVLELSFTAWDMKAFAGDLGDGGAPFVWDDERRALLRAELDAAFFHLYGVERDDVDYILDTFPIVRRKDEARYGGYRTKQLILEIYDAMAEAEATDTAYRTVLDPPPGEGPRHPPRREP